MKTLSLLFLSLSAFGETPNAEVYFREDIIKRELDPKIYELKDTRDVDQCVTANIGLFRRPVSSPAKGVAQMAGVASFDIVRNTAQIQIDISVKGTVKSQTQSSSRRTVMANQTDANFELKAPLVIDNQGPRFKWVNANATLTRNTRQIIPQGNCQPRRFRIFRTPQERREDRVRNRVSQDWAIQELDRVAKQNVENSLIENFQKTTGTQIGRLNKIELPEEGSAADTPLFKVLRPFVTKKAIPTFHSGSSTDESLTARFHYGKQGQDAPDSLCPFTLDGHVSACLHGSFFTNIAEALIGGQNVSDREIKDLSNLMNDFVPLNLEVHKRSTPWLIRMAATKPIRFVFENEKILKLELGLDEAFISRKQIKGPMRAFATYALELDDLQRVVFKRRKEDIEFRFPREISAEDREFLETKLTTLLAEKTDFAGLAVPSSTGAMGVLERTKLDELDTQDGWLMLKSHVREKNEHQR